MRLKKKLCEELVYFVLSIKHKTHSVTTFLNYAVQKENLEHLIIIIIIIIMYTFIYCVFVF